MDCSSSARLRRGQDGENVYMIAHKPTTSPLSAVSFTLEWDDQDTYLGRLDGISIRLLKLRWSAS